MALSNILLALAVSTVAATSSQIPVSDTVIDQSYQILTHDDYPSHSLSIKPHVAQTGLGSSKVSGDSVADVCPGATSGYTGYLNTGDKHFYFAYFESRDKPHEDPLVMWINGGPGCSSMTGLLMELGPCTVNEGGDSARENKNSWINNANVFFLDQPIGVGFSYSDNTSEWKEARGTFAASEDIYAFMRLWYQKFPESKSQPFSIAGESYGGHYIPIFAEHISAMNQISSSEAQIPLESVLIGNGIFANTVQATSSYDISCTNATGIGPLLNSTVCARMESSVGRCEYLLKACDAYPDPLICNAAGDFCGDELEMPYVESGRNYYDVSKPCEGPLCYPIMKDITKFLTTDRVRTAFGVNPDAPKFEACSGKVGRQFARANDGLIDTRPYVAALLHAGIRVQIYVGTYDWICNFVGNERVFGGLEWKGMPDFRYQQENNKQPWSGGLWWESGLLRYVRVNGAGHMVPWDKPVEALKMFKAWLAKEKLD